MFFFADLRLLPDISVSQQAKILNYYKHLQLKIPDSQRYSVVISFPSWQVASKPPTPTNQKKWAQQKNIFTKLRPSSLSSCLKKPNKSHSGVAKLPTVSVVETHLQGFKDLPLASTNRHTSEWVAISSVSKSFPKQNSRVYSVTNFRFTFGTSFN